MKNSNLDNIDFLKSMISDKNITVLLDNSGSTGSKVKNDINQYILDSDLNINTNVK